MEVQDIIVYSLFIAAIAYYAVRFYSRMIKKKTASSKGCSTDKNCGCH